MKNQDYCEKEYGYAYETKEIRTDSRLKNKLAGMHAALIFSIVLLLITLIASIIPSDEDADIYDKVLRLHVLADSDSESDQRLKLLVRDSVLKTLGEKLENCTDLSSATSIAQTETESVIAAAEATLRAEGCYDSVSVELGTEHYPTREYEGVRLPAGSYNSLRVIIGSGSGQNWWCVLFPAMCTGAAADPVEEFTEAGFTPGQVKVLTETEEPRYVLRFRFLEIFDDIKQHLFSSSEEDMSE